VGSRESISLTCEVKLVSPVLYRWGTENGIHLQLRMPWLLLRKSDAIGVVGEEWRQSRGHQQRGADRVPHPAGSLRRSGTEVQSVVVIVSEEWWRCLREKSQDHACFLGHLVDEGQGHTRGSCTNDGAYAFVQKTRDFSLVCLVVGVTGVTFDNVKVMPASAALMSAAAKATPASSGGPRNAREPVTGRAVPILRAKDSTAADVVSLLSWLPLLQRLHSR